MLSWQMPSLPGAFLSTMDIRALFLIIALIILDIAMYYPFFKAHENNVFAWKPWKKQKNKTM